VSALSQGGAGGGCGDGDGGLGLDATVLEDAHQGARDAVVGYQFLENLMKFCHELYPSPEAGRDRRGQVRRSRFADPE
jgi:hypothetical protein